MSERVTIKSIARDLGISHMTVSRALSDHPNVRPETREAVRARAAELAYVKSAAASTMRGGGPRIVGLLVPNIVNEFYARFADTLARACEAEGLQLVIHLTSDDAARERLALQRLREVQAMAAVLVPTPLGEAEGADAPEERAPQGMRIVHLIRTRPSAQPRAALLVDDGASIAAAVDHLVGRGHRAVAYLGATDAFSSGRERLAAFQRAMRRHGFEPHPAHLRTDAPSFEMGARSAEAVLRGDPAASAIVCGGFEISNGALDACLRLGRRMPQDVAFVGYGDPAFYRWIGGGVSTVALPVEALARRALDLVRSDPDLPGQGPCESPPFETAFVARGSS